MRLLVLASVSVLSLCAATATATSASASGGPGKPSGEHLVAATSSSITIGLNPTRHATGYQLYVSTTKAHLYGDYVKAHHPRHVTSRGPRLTQAGLRYTSAPMYYRIIATAGNYHGWGDVHTTGLRPARPTGVQAHTAPTGAYLTWANQNANSYVVSQATNAAMTTGRVTRRVDGRHLQYTPYGLTRGRTYYFRVQASNWGARSTSSAQVRIVASRQHRDIRVLTYNVLTNLADGHHQGGGTVAPWAARRPNIVALIRRAVPDVVNLEEAGGWVGLPQGYGGHRQVDDLLRLMPEFRLARTEVPPSEHGYLRSCDYIVYRRSTMRPVGAGGNWSLGGGHHAAYQVLQNIASGAKVLVVAPHLSADPPVARFDAERQRETALMVTAANRLATAAHVPVVYAGDFNSDDASHAFDGPGRAMQAARVVNARDVALLRYHEQYNSSNQYYRTPPAFGDDIDYVYTGPGIAVRSWGMVLALSHGKFVGAIPSDHNPIWATISIPY